MPKNDLKAPNLIHLRYAEAWSSESFYSMKMKCLKLMFYILLCLFIKII